MIKKLFIYFIYILSIIIFIPFLVSYPYMKNKTNYNNTKNNIDIINNLEYLENKNNLFDNATTNNNLENYIIGVVSAEMPVSFHTEALKAQAVSARTYAYRRLDDINKPIDYKKIGQAYIDIPEMKKRWGNNFNSYYNKIKNAVNSTNGEILTYNNEPIEAVFHSTSAGTTELPENIWGKSLPYIKSVDSSVDKNAPNFIYEKTIPNKIIIDTISKKYKNIKKENIIPSFNIKKRSNAGYVLSVEIDNTEISGFDIRIMLKLRSTNFIIKKNKDSITFTTKGYGHGAGMSQYGANFMAEDGKNYKDILNHYYKNISITSIY